MIDPAIQQILAGMSAAGLTIPDNFDATILRAMLDQTIPVPPIQIAEVRNLKIAGGNGQIEARLYHPAPGTALPLTIFSHGGGWVVGTLDTHDGMARLIARDAHCVVLSLAYRLAPENPFPAAYDDVYAAVLDSQARAEELGVIPGIYALAGDSSGGNLAAATAIRLANSVIPPRHQLLFYPVVDRDFNRNSYRNAAPSGFLTNAMMRFFWEKYLGDAKLDERSAPLQAKDLSKVAPATVILAGYDPLHDEGFAYAHKLQVAGVQTSLYDFSGGIHGFASFAGMAPIADLAMNIATASLRTAFV